MASNCEELYEILKQYCYTVHALENFITLNNIDPNHTAVVRLRNELITRELISDSETYRLLQYCCNTFTELSSLVVEYGWDWNDAAVRARQRDLQV